MKFIFCNVQLLPFGISGGNIIRATFLESSLAAYDADLLMLCETYDKKASVVIHTDLSDTMYSYGPFSGGITIFSKVKLMRGTRSRPRQLGHFWIQRFRII